MAFHEYPYTDFHEMNLDWVIAKVKELTLAWAQTSSDWEELRTFVNDYFANLDVQEEINNKMNELVNDGTLSSLIAPYVASGLPAEVANQIAAVVAQQIGAVVAAQLPAEVAEQIPAAVAGEAANWLSEHVDPSTGYVVDDTLTIRGAAADAKVAGDAISELKSALKLIANRNIALAAIEFKGKGFNDQGELSPLNECDITEYIDLKNITSIMFSNSITIGGTVHKLHPVGFFYDESKQIVGKIDPSTRGIHEINTPETAKFCRFCISNQDADDKILILKQNAYFDEIGALLSESLSTINKNIDEANTSISATEAGVVFGSSSTFCYATIFNKTAYLGDIQDSTYKNNTWPIIAENDNAVILRTVNGSIYYAKKDLSVLTAIKNGAALNLPTYIVAKNNETVCFSNDEITISEINTLLSASSISDSFSKIKLGIAANKAMANVLIPFVFSRTIDNLNFKIKNNNAWANKTGDFLGDSLTAGGRYTAAFTSLYGVTVNNYGVSGTTISNIRQSDMFYTRIPDMSTSCDFVFVMGGTNDWGLGAPLGDKSHIVSHDYSTFYSALYNTLVPLRKKFPFKPIFVATITQRNWQGGQQASGIWNNGNGASIMDFNDAIRFVANIIGAIVIDSFGCGIVIDNLSSYTDDNLHFNNSGGARFATYCMDMMKQITPY